MNNSEYNFLKPKLQKCKLGSYKSILDACHLMGITVDLKDLHRIKLLLLEKKMDDEVLSSYEKITPEMVLELEQKHSTQVSKTSTSTKAKIKPDKAESKTNIPVEPRSHVSMNQTVKQYKIVSDKHHYSLQNQIVNAIKEGWQPMGGVGVYHPGGNPLGGQPDNFFQVIVKYE